MLPFEADSTDAAAVTAFLTERNSARVARRGELIDATVQQALIVIDGDDIRGVLTYVIRGQECEILTLHAEPRQAGFGTALIESIATRARDRGCSRLWLTTTNDNIDALRFYQRRGFVLAALWPAAVERARRSLKPEIPLVGNHGISLRDELKRERTLR